ncbi:MAG: hypothetical protein JWO06_985 [Bacteroidota bacterium]|nr:hypothetical protein [Bacteroidota bacterium]
MKKIILLFALLAASFLYNAANAQVSVNVNIGLQPVWGPVGYDRVDYYYLPDIEAYYYVPQHQFIYNEGGAWITASSLPGRYASFDLYNSHKVVINEPKPYLHHDIYRAKYVSFKGHHDQHAIRDSHDSRYFEIKEHPEHSKWKGNGGGHEQHQEHGKDEHHGNDKHGDDHHKK